MLYRSGKIIEKEYGKSKVYFADQSQFPTVDEAELKAMDEEIETLEEEVKELQSQITSFRTGKSYSTLSLTKVVMNRVKRIGLCSF